MLKLCDVLDGEHRVVDKHLADPLSRLSQDVHFPVVKGKLLAKKLMRAELNVFRLVPESLRREQGPRTVEENVGSELLLTFV